MTRKVLLHIGLPKTGTTFLQEALWANKAELGQRGVLLPGGDRRRHLLASLDLREDPKLARRPGDVAHPWRDLVEEVLAWDGSAAVISHEFFAAASSAQVRRAVESFPDLELHVIVTARDMVGLGLSRWQEWVKNGGRAGVDAYPGTDDYDPTDEWGWGSFDLADILNRWGSVIQHERIHVLPMVTGPAPRISGSASSMSSAWRPPACPPRRRRGTGHSASWRSSSCAGSTRGSRDSPRQATAGTGSAATSDRAT